MDLRRKKRRNFPKEGEKKLRSYFKFFILGFTDIITILEWPVHSGGFFMFYISYFLR